MKCKECKNYTCQYRDVDSERDCVLQEVLDQELIRETSRATLDYIDWLSFRRSVAFNILGSLLQREGWGLYVTHTPREVAKTVVGQVDELINVLKRG